MHRRWDRPVPAQPRAVRAATPAGRLPGQPAQPGEQRPHRRGPTGGGSREPDRGAQQVHGEVGGELDGRLEVVVHHRRARGRGARGGRHPCRHDGRGGRPGRPAAQPVHAQRGAPPAQVRTVGAGTPGRQAPVDLLPAGAARRRGGRQAAGSGAEHPHRHPDGRPHSEVGRAVQLGRLGRAGAEQPGEPGGRGGTHVGAGAGCDLHSHGAAFREVVAAVGEGTAGKGEPTDGDAREPRPGTTRSGRVTEPLRGLLREVDDPSAGAVTCRPPDAKGHLTGRSGGR